jgi:predicted lipoprotein with Yx(FWY)xxD motif
MKKFIIALVVIVVVVLVYLFASHHSVTTPVSAPVADTTSQVGTTSAAAVPGDNLTLGQSNDPSLGDYLVAYNGMTLYTYSPDTAGVSNCTGGCAANWPPYTVTSKDNLVAESPIAGAISTLTRADGTMQVTYNGAPLYFYVKDTKPGDTVGEGVGGVWYVVKP